MQTRFFRSAKKFLICLAGAELTNAAGPEHATRQEIGPSKGVVFNTNYCLQFAEAEVLRSTWLPIASDGSLDIRETQRISRYVCNKVLVKIEPMVVFLSTD